MDKHGICTGHSLYELLLQTNRTPFFDVLLTVYLSIFILAINQIDAQNFVFQ